MYGYDYDPLAGIAAFHAAVAKMADRDREIATTYFNAGYMQANADKSDTPDWQEGYSEGRSEASKEFSQKERVYFWMIGIGAATILILGGIFVQGVGQVWHLVWQAKCPAPIIQTK